MADIIQMRGDLEANWISANPILIERELAFTTNSTPVKMKIGNGTSTWSQLEYFAGLNGTNGINGIDGRSIITAVVNGSGHLILTFSDLTTLDVGNVKGEKGENGTGSGDMLASAYDPVIKSITGKALATTVADYSLATLWTQVNSASPSIPIGWLFCVFRLGRNQTWKDLVFDSYDVNGAPQNPTSLVVTIYKNGVLAYTSPAITTATLLVSNANLSFTANDLVRIVTSNTTGLTGGITITPKWVNP